MTQKIFTFCDGSGCAQKQLDKEQMAYRVYVDGKESYHYCVSCAYDFFRNARIINFHDYETVLPDRKHKLEDKTLWAKIFIKRLPGNE